MPQRGDEIDVGDFIASATFFDIVVLLIAGGMFVVGWLQGTIRQLAGIAAFLVALVIAANLRDPVGDFLARNWTFYDRDFNLLLAFLGLWLTFAVSFQLVIQLYYTRVVLHARLLLLDEVMGGLLGAFQVLLVLAVLIVILDPYYATVPPSARADIAWARNVADLLQGSGVGAALRDGLAPVLVAVLGPLLPADVVAHFR